MYDAMKTLERLGTPRALVLGDVMLDRYTWGNAARISPEAPVLVLRSDLDEVRPGGAASVAYLLAGLEAQVSVCGVIGRDADGRTLRRLLDESGINPSLIRDDPGRVTTCKERIIGRAANHPHQLVRVDREDDRPLDRELEDRLLAAILDRLPECDVVLISDYGKGVCSRRLLAAVMTAAADLEIPALVDPARDADYARYRGAALLKPNRAQAEMASGVAIGSPRDALTAGRLLRERSRVESVLITLDAEGMALVPAGGKGQLFATRPRDVYDVTGAGDMALATLGLCVASGISFRESACLANIAAGLEVEKFGVATVRREDIRADLSLRPARRGGKVVALTGGEIVESCGDCVHVAAHGAGVSTTEPAEKLRAINLDVAPLRATRKKDPASRVLAKPARNGRAGVCQHLGPEVGLRECSTCEGHVRQKVFACNHPNHTDTTLADCKRCPDFAAAIDRDATLVSFVRKKDAATDAVLSVKGGIDSHAVAEVTAEQAFNPDKESGGTYAGSPPNPPASNGHGEPLPATATARVPRYAERLRTAVGLATVGPESFAGTGRLSRPASRETATARKLILQSFQSPGDMVMLTAAVRDLHLAYPGQFETDVRTSVPALWENNPHITPLDAAAHGARLIDMHYDLINQSNSVPYHFIHGYAQHLERQLGLRIPVTSFQGDVHLTQEEKQWISQVEELGFHGDFWIVMAGGKHDFTAKWWNPASYQQVVDHFRGRIQFVQCGEEGHFHPPLAGVINQVGKTDARQFIRLMYHAAGVLCPVTYAMHLAAAVETKPGRPPRACVVVGGGREPPHWEAYPHHQYISTVGALPCCQHGGCWRSRCQTVGDGDSKDKENALCERPVQVSPQLRIAQCMEMITAEDVIRRIELYYEGESLAYLDEQKRPG